MLEFLKVILLGIVEGITEWLPISSTGHMILVEQFVKLNVTDAFDPGRRICEAEFQPVVSGYV